LATSSTFDDLMRAAEQQLWIGFKLAETIDHRLSRGLNREETVALFLEDQLPARFAVTTGEAVDASEERTGQLDIVIYDRNLTGPLLKGKSGDLLPAESLLAVVEVKSKLTAAEMTKCVRAARKVSSLKPYGKTMSLSRKDGQSATDGRPRCMFSVVAFGTDLVEADWAAREWRRASRIMTQEEVEPDTIDRVLVLGRGMLLPPSKKARTDSGADQSMLREWFLHLTNFIVREANRRKAFDFSDYARKKTAKGWQDL
jgi:hypothetical protein